MPRPTPCLWFDTQGREAAEFYVSVFPRSEINSVSMMGDSDSGRPEKVLTVEFVLDGQPFLALNGGPQFAFTEAVSFLITCADQEEVDYYWTRLSEGGEEGPCGWLKDRYGLSWQVVPADFPQYLSDPDEGRRQRATQAFMSMKKIDIAALAAAADGE